jgi:methionyl-tRNA formyltransferase
VSHARSLFVIEHCGLVFAEPASPGAAIPGARLLFLGDDEHGVPLEVMSLELDNGDLLVIHAMKLRAIYEAQYLEALSCRIAR